ncbi:hypothetical protein ACF0H5_004633 [Mactra antiquata]
MAATWVNPRGNKLQMNNVKESAQRYKEQFNTKDNTDITMKIIGGRQVPVIEKHQQRRPGYINIQRLQPLRPITEKPNYIDPRNEMDETGGYYNKDMVPNAYFIKRPDSKEVVRGQQKRLPETELYRNRNDMSTVFEAEPWTGNKTPPLASDTEYTQNYFSSKLRTRRYDTYDRLEPREERHVTVDEKQNLMSLIPSNVLIPNYPITLTRDQESTLCEIICKDLMGFTREELNDTYLECYDRDKNQDGFCTFDVLDDVLQRQRVYLSNTLRVIAAQFVDPDKPGYVNYEKVLSFIGYALKLNEKDRVFRIKNSEHQAREKAKMERTVEQELEKNAYTLHWGRWRDAFLERDIDRRDTLSAAQMKDVCYDQHLPISDSLINKILSICENRSNEGQYRWQDFLNFLHIMRPNNTVFPKPKRDLSPQRNLQLDNRHDTDRGRHAKDYVHVPETEETKAIRKERIHQLMYQYKDLEKKYNITMEGVKNADKSWTDRFIQMAQALYNCDVSSKGSLPREDVLEIVKQCNYVFNLDLDLNRVEMMCISPENLDKSGNIILRTLLANLTAFKNT